MLIMRNFEILPTEENVFSTFCNNVLGRNEDVKYFYEMLMSYDFSASIAIDGRWGSGKTFFVHHVMLLIDAMNSNSNLDSKKRDEIMSKVCMDDSIKPELTSMCAVYYDAWKNDNDNEPILSLIYEIASQLCISINSDWIDGKKKFCNLAGTILECLSKKNINNMIECLKSENPFEEIKKQRSIENRISEFFKMIPEERANKVVIFIDELDRCKPVFTIRLLEQIKHYINDDRVMFVFSVNIDELQHTIKKYYGNGFDACRYLDRFFFQRISLPPTNKTEFYEYMGLGSRYYVDIVTRRICDIYNMQYREMTRYCSQVRTAVYKITHMDVSRCIFPVEKGHVLVINIIVPLLIALRNMDTSKYNNFVNGKDYEPLMTLFSEEDNCLEILRYFLNDKDSSEEKEDKIKITKDEMLMKVYNAIFNNDKEYKSGVMIGGCEFDNKTKEFAIRCSNMMTSSADYSI